MVETNYRKKILKKTAIDAIIKNVKNGKNTEDQRHLIAKKRTVRTPGSQLCCFRHRGGSLAEHRVSRSFKKKSARWVPKLLLDE